MRDLGARRPGDLVTQADGRGLTNGLGPVRDAVSPATFDGAQTYERSALLAGLLATALGVVVLAGWAAGLEPLKSFLPGDLPMKANAAVLLVLSGTTLTLQGSGRRTRVEDALAIVILGVATATALEYVAGVDLGIDRLLAPDVAQPGAPYAGRMAVGAVLGFAVTALALLVMGRSWRGWHPSAFLAIVAGLIGVLGILGYLYGASQLTSIGSVTQVAFPAALGLSVLAAGLVAADPEHGLMRLLRDPGLAGQLTRRLVPTIVLVLPVAGWLEIGLVQAGTLDEPVGVAAMVCLDILVLGGVGIWIAGGVAGLEDAKAAAQHDRDRVVDTSEDLIAATDVEGRLTLVSPSWTRDLGYAPDELLGHAIAEFIHPDDLAADGSAFLAAVGHAGHVSGHVNRGRARDGTYRWLEWNSTRDPETGQLYVAGRDITRRKAADVALSESEERFRTLIESAPDAILMWDGELRCLEANRAACERLGYTRDEMLTMKATDISAPQGVGRAAAHAESIARTGSGLVETVHKRRDGTFIPVEVSSTVVRFGGRPVLLSIARDITARKAAEDHLAQAEARYRGLLEAAPDAMVVVDGRGEIVLLNLQTETQFGYSRDELVGQPVTNIIPEGFAERIIADDLRSTADALAQVIGTGIELVALRKDGTEFPIEIMLSPLESAEGILVTAAIRDITARKAVEAEIRGLNTELEQRVLARTIALVAANAELEAFSYSVSHDLRAPLRSIAAFSQILLNEYAAPLDAEGRRIMAIVLRNVKQMGTLIEDLLAFSRVSRASLDRRPVDMARLARGVAEELGAACPGRVIAIDVGPLADVPGDAGLLRQVWANLLGNAVKFTRPVEHATVEVRSERANGEFRFTVRDNGVGFDPAYLDKLFAPFSRLHATADFEGTGIGLAIVARIVARHGGRVWAEGAPGEGALFGFSIPEHLEAA
jgi:PAS domain S-box-containing protein